MQDTREVAAALREIAALIEFAKAPKFKVNAYRRAAEVVATVGDVGPLVEQGRLTELAGIGEALSRLISELWNTGGSALLARLRSELPPGASELVQVKGITPRRLRALSDALGVSSVLELRDGCRAARVQLVAGFGQATEARLLAACEDWLHRSEPTPPPTLLARALERAAQLEPELAKASPRVVLADDARRGEETVRELEWVVLGDERCALEPLERLRQVLRIEPGAPVAHLSEGLRLELHGSAAESFGNTLVLATGNAAHVAALSARAEARGFRLRGWAQTGRTASAERAFADEDALYAALDCAFVPPELRNGSDELARAERTGFDDLIAAQHIQGLVHCHTTYSDGRNSVLEMAREAHALGMKYITITDHSPSAQYAGGVPIDRLKQQWDEIAAAEEQVPIRILRGTESDILADGSLDYPDTILEQLDLVIASIHARHQMDRGTMTERLKRALSLPLFKIWGHALGRILNHREPFACDLEAVLDALAGAPGAIELNADPHRLDLAPAWIPAARARNIPFVISVDAHSTHGLGVLGYGVTMARRGGLSRSEVLNTGSAAQFAARVRPVHRERGSHG